MATTIDATLLMPGITEEVMNTDKPILADGQIELIRGKGFKQGDGSTTADLLPYIAGGGGGVSLGGTNYLFVEGGGTPEENFQELIEAYAQAGVLSNNGNNPITVLVAPGYYYADHNDPDLPCIVFDKPGVSVMSLTGRRDVIIRKKDGFEYQTGLVLGAGSDLNFKGAVFSGLDLGGNLSFEFKGTSVTYSYVTIHNCRAGRGFGHTAITLNYVKIIDCQANVYAFGSSSTNGGTYIRCDGGSSCFSSKTTYIDCRGTNGCFNGRGVYEFCVAALGSWAQPPSEDTRLYYCRLISGAFHADLEGKMFYCIEAQ